MFLISVCPSILGSRRDEVNEESDLFTSVRLLFFQFLKAFFTLFIAVAHARTFVHNTAWEATLRRAGARSREVGASPS